MSDFERPPEYIEVDRGGCRFTHYPSGDTLMRHEWLQQPSHFGKWDELRRAFFDSHPEANLLLGNMRGIDSTKLSLIGDVNDFPWRDGFKRGDIVVTPKGNPEEGNLARLIVDELPNGDPRFLSADDLEISYILEDGSVMFWSPQGEQWNITGGDMADAMRRNVRVRRPHSSDDIAEIRIDIKDILLSRLDAVSAMLRYVSDTPETSGTVADELKFLENSRIQLTEASLHNREAMYEALAAIRGPDIRYRYTGVLFTEEFRRGLYAISESIRALEETGRENTPSAF